jgi:hypothetical protein
MRFNFNPNKCLITLRRIKCMKLKLILILAAACALFCSGCAHDFNHDLW